MGKVTHRNRMGPRTLLTVQDGDSIYVVEFIEGQLPNYDDLRSVDLGDSIRVDGILVQSPKAGDFVQAERFTLGSGSP